jgi:hypothetical protein
VFGIVFLASGFAHWTVPWYLPLEHRWQLAKTPVGVAIDWYGRSSLSLSVGAIAGVAAFGLTSLKRIGPLLVRKGAMQFVAHLGALMIVNDVLFYVLTLVTRHPTPSPIPSWYCPR